MTAQIHDFDTYASAHAASLSLSSLILTNGPAGQRNSKIRAGLTCDTCVMTATGPRRADSLRAGDMLVTHDTRLQPLMATETCETRVAGIWAPIYVPSGRIGNTRALVLCPNQSVMFEGPMARLLSGRQTAVVQAHALVALSGVTRVAGQSAPRVFLNFAAPRVIYAEGAQLVCGDQPWAGITASTTRVRRAIVLSTS